LDAREFHKSFTIIHPVTVKRGDTRHEVNHECLSSKQSTIKGFSVKQISRVSVGLAFSS